MSEAVATGVVVGVDGSPGSIRALRWAADFAVSKHLPLETITVWEPPIEFGWTYPTALRTYDWQAAGRQIVDASFEEVFGTAHPEGVIAHIRQGYPASELIRASRGATALVVGSRGHGRFASTLLGSVSIKCVEHAHCAVVVVRPDTTVRESGQRQAEAVRTDSSSRPHAVSVSQ